MDAVTADRTLPRRPVPLWLSTALVVLAALSIIITIHPGPLPGEVGYVRALQRLGQPAPAIAEIVRTITGTEGVLVAAALPIVWLLGTGERSGRRVVVIVLAATLIVQPVYKEVVDRPRPAAEVVDVRAENESYSFPSGHSLSTTTAYGSVVAALWVFGRRRWACVAAVPIALTFFSSAIQGAHWPTDAIAGTLVGAIAVWLLIPHLLGAASALSRRSRS